MYPGYEPDEVTPLPQPFLAREILLTVIDAQRDLRKKVRKFHFKTEKKMKRIHVAVDPLHVTRLDYSD